MSEKLLITEADFTTELEKLGFASLTQLNEQDIAKLYASFLTHCNSDQTLPFLKLSEDLLSRKDWLLGFVTQFASNLIITGYGVGSTQLPPELSIKVGQLFLPYFSATSIAASTFIVGASTITGEALATLSQLNGREKLAKALKLSLPVLGAITAAAYQYIAEFHLHGTFDYNDIFFGVLAVGTGYIGFRFVSNLFNSIVVKIHLTKEIKNFITEKISIADITVEVVENQEKHLLL